MPDETSAAYERLRTSAQRLNSAVDAAAQLVNEAEVILEEARVGLEASVRVRTDEKNKQQTHYDLAYLSWGARFRICVAEKAGQSSEPVWVRTWAECSRDTKLATIKNLPELLVEIARIVEQHAGFAEKTLAEVSGRLPSLKKKKGA